MPDRLSFIISTSHSKCTPAHVNLVTVVPLQYGTYWCFYGLGTESCTDCTQWKRMELDRNQAHWLRLHVLQRSRGSEMISFAIIYHSHQTTWLRPNRKMISFWYGTATCSNKVWVITWSQSCEMKAVASWNMVPAVSGDITLHEESPENSPTDRLYIR